MYVRNHMTKTEELVAKQREYFRSGVTLPCRFRCEMLDRLYHTIRMSESEIEAAFCPERDQLPASPPFPDDAPAEGLHRPLQSPRAE